MEAKDQDGNESEKRNVLKIEEGKELIEPGSREVCKEQTQQVA